MTKTHARYTPMTTTVAAAMLSALAYLLMLLEFPLLPAVPYLKMDFGDIPAIFGAVVFGPVCGVTVELVKNLLEMLTRGIGQQLGFGNLQNFLIGCAYLIPFSLLYRWMERREFRLPAPVRALIPAAAGVALMLVVGFLSNWVMAPLFFRFFLNNPLGAGEALSAAWVSVPFNALKGGIVTVLMVPLLALSLGPVRRALDKNP